MNTYVDPTAEAETPEGDLGLFSRLKTWVRDSMSEHADWYTEAEECFGFVAGRSLKGKGQWPGTSWDDMMDSGRQPIEFNRVGPIVDAICGLEVNNRQEVKYLPRTAGDGEVDERLSSLGDWARDETNAEDEESEMFRHAVICGRGFTETRIDFDEEPTGKIIMDCLDPLEVGVDPASRKPCFVDARYIWRYRDIATDEAAAMFPGVMSSALDASWANNITTKDGGDGNKTDYPDETRPGMSSDQPPRVVRMVQIQWWEREEFHQVAMPGAEGLTEMSSDAWAQLDSESGEMPEGQRPTAEKSSRRKYRQAFIGHSAILDTPTDIAGFTIRAVTGRFDRNKGYHYGVVRPMRDPQMLANKTLSQVLHILNTNAKGGLLIEAGAFRNPKDAEKDWSNPAKTILLTEGGLGKIQPRVAPPIPQALPLLQEFSISSIRDVTGVSVEMLGLADRDQPASLEYQRRQSAMTILASLFNGLRNYRKLQGRTMLEQLKMLPPGVLVRVLIDPQQAQAEYEQAVMQWSQQPAIQQFHMAAQQAQQQGQPAPPPPPNLPPPPEKPGAEFMSSTKRGEMFDPAKFGLGPDARFDVIVDEMTSSPNQKEATWAAIQPFMAQLPPNAIPIALKYSPLPETAAKELGDAIAQGMGGGEQGPDPQTQAMIQQGAAKISEQQDQIKQLQDKSAIDQANVGIKAQDAETRRMKVIGDLSHQDVEHHLNALSQYMDHVRSMNQPDGGEYGG